MIAIGRATRPVTTQTPALFSLFFLGQYWLDDLQRSRVQLLVRPLLARLKGRGIPPNALAPLIADLVEKLPGCGCILKTDGHVGHQIPILGRRPVLFFDRVETLFNSGPRKIQVAILLATAAN